jgi:hypothetical protein
MYQSPFVNRSCVVSALCVTGVLALACSTDSRNRAASTENPAAPSGVPATSTSEVPGTASEMTVSRQHGIELTPVVGSGSGIVNDTATANDGGFTLRAQVNVNVHGVPPDTLLYVQIAADAGLPDGQQTDGTCQRADAGVFAPLVLFPGGPPATLQTSPGGAGAAHMTAGLNIPFLPDGARTDLVIRVIDALPPATPTVELRTPCYQFQVK